MWLQEIPEYFHFARVHVGDPYRVLRNPPPQCFSLAPRSGDPASFVTEFTFSTRSPEHSRGLNLSSQTLRSRLRV